MLKRLLVVVLLLLPVMVGAISDVGDLRVTRLWDTDQDFVCTGFYIEGPALAREYLLESRSWFATAGHCTYGTLVAGRTLEGPKAPVDIRAKLLGHEACKPSEDFGRMVCENRWDAAVGVTKSPVKKGYRLAAKDAEPGEPVFIHGFGFGVENIVMGVTASVDQSDTDGFLLIKGITGLVFPGNSGSPVLNKRGEVVGILVAVRCIQPGFFGCAEVDAKTIYATPVSVIKKLLAS